MVIIKIGYSKNCKVKQDAIENGDNKNCEVEHGDIKYGDIKNNVTKHGHIECNNIEINSNVTCNVDNNVTPEQNIHPVTHKNKKQNKNKKLREERDNNDNSDYSSNNNSQSPKESEYVSDSENIYSKAIELAAYCEKLTGRIGLLDITGLNMAVEIHGSENVKKAIEKSIENGTIKLNYILGILRNWAKEGYPEDECDSGVNRSKKKYGECDSRIKGSKKKYGGGNGYGAECSNKGSGPDKNEFEGIRPRQPRKLSEEERRKASANVV